MLGWTALNVLGQCDDVNANDVCDAEETGCTVELACNYDAEVVFEENASCDFVSCLALGCTDSGACNFDSNANFDDGTCSYPSFPYGCDGECLEDSDDDGICDAFETPGCTNAEACNFSSGATQEDGSCTFDCQGCTTSGACNFDPEALIDDGSCDYTSCLSLGCTEEAACNFDPEAGFNDGSCDFDSCQGCTNSDACNYDPSSSQDDGSCILAGFALDCQGNCLSDADNDGVCDEFEVGGCAQTAACNYNPEATDDDGSCDFCSCAEAGGIQTTSSTTGYDIELETVMVHESGSLDGMTTYRVYVTTVNATDGLSAVVGDDEFPLSLTTTTSFYQEPIFGGATPANNSAAAMGLLPDLAYDSWVTIGLEGPSTSSAGEVNASLLSGAWTLAFEDGESFLVDDNQGSGWYLLPPTATNSLAGDSKRVLVAQLTTSGDLSGSFRGQVFPEGDQENDLRVDLSFSTGGNVPVCGCTDEEASNFNSGATLDDGSCAFDVLGCTIELACNYNPEATVNDGSCDFVSCLTFGCTDEEACNYDAEATFEDGTCSYPSFPYDCNGDCVNDDDGDGTCDEFEIFGCTDELACNYASGATNDDGLCNFDCYGCANPAACNFDPSALLDDGSCEFTSCIVIGCTDPEACNYENEAEFDNGTCTFIVEGDCDCDGNQLDALGICGGDCGADDNTNGVCDDEEVLGCTSALACNYDATATVNDNSCDFISCLSFGCTDLEACNYNAGAQFDDGSCSYASFPYDCDGACVNDEDGDDVCDEFEIPGCTNASACNYNDEATDDGGNCIYADVYLDCDGNCLNDANGDGLCDELEQAGCTDYNACNFDPSATFDDGSCLVLDACGICGGPGDIYECGCSDIPEGDCDCDGNQLDALGVCGGDCAEDADADGICDDVDECVGELDACGICNGPGDIYECGCSDIPEGDCDCDGNQLDAIGICGGSCTEDSNNNGICDDVEDCLGFVDACGICNGPGPIYPCGCSNIPEGDCDCDGNQLDVIGVCGGDCTTDADADGICDDVDECIGELDACGLCNGPGEIYECGCADIPEGDCDCDGNQLDALGVCGGNCGADDNANGLCDTEEIVGCTDSEACNYNADATFEDGSCAELDSCGICGGPGAVYECGCTDIPEGDCDCDGNQDDAIGVCGGDCLEDSNDNNICDTDEQGCTDATNPNYDPNAAFDDGSCFVGGCTFESACNYNPNADYQIQGACDFTSCQGCTNPEACNYDEEATLDNGLCDLPDFAYDCDGNCLSDQDGDGVCDELEVPGCTDQNSPNFDPYATEENGTCLVGGCNIVSACNFDPSADYLLAGACEFSSCVGCTDIAACNYEPEATVTNLSLCTYPSNNFLDCDGACVNDSDEDGICDELEIPGCTDAEASNYNPQATDDNGTCQAPLVGGCLLPFACNFDPSANFYLPGSCDFAPCGGVAPIDNCVHPDACNYGAEGPCDFLSCVAFGCNVELACNFDPNAQFNDGTCEFGTCTGCTNPQACDFNPEATIAGGCYDFSSCVGCMLEGADNYDVNATSNGNQCLFSGCTVPGACNFDVTANVNDGSCDFNSCSGCQDDSACNFDSNAQIAGYCEFPSANFDCDGNCLLDNCEAFVVAGCTDACACNFDPFANTPDASCEFSSCSGCVYPIAENYDEGATRDDGSCIFEGCTDSEFATYSPQANAFDGQWCSNVPTSADFNQDGLVQVEDLTQFLQAFALTSPSWGGIDWIVQGCTANALTAEEMLAGLMANQTAGPWNPACGVPTCNYPGALNFNPEGGMDHGICLFAGCTDPDAFNFDRLASVDDNTCRYDVCPDFNGDGEVQIADLMDFLLLWGN